VSQALYVLQHTPFLPQSRAFPCRDVQIYAKKENVSKTHKLDAVARILSMLVNV